MSLHSWMHSLQMNTPGPAITFATAELGLAQNEQLTWRVAGPVAVSLVMPPPVSRRQEIPDSLGGHDIASGPG